MVLRKDLLCNYKQNPTRCDLWEMQTCVIRETCLLLSDYEYSSKKNGKLISWSWWMILSLFIGKIKIAPEIKERF